MNKNDARYFRTAAKMDEALLRLLEKKDFEYITVGEICREAGVNRSTFYLHYENTVDLLREATSHVIDGFLSYFSEHRGHAPDPTVADLEDIIFVKTDYLLPYLTYIRENRRVFRTTLHHLDMMGFDGVYQRMLQRFFDPILARFHIPEADRPYMMKFYLTGVTAIAMEWLDDDCRLSAEEVCRIIIRCVMGKVHEGSDV